MKFWKKQIFSLLAALAVLLTLVPQRAEAASCGLSGAGSVRAGNTVTVTFSISGGDILGFEADLSYDSSQLSLEGSKSLLGSSWTVKMNGSRIVGYDSEQSNPINGSKQVMALTFRVKSGASAGSSLSAAVSGVSVSYIRSSDGNAVTVDAGSARWSASVSAPLSANANLASLSCANAELSPTFSAGTTQYSVTVPYDVTSLRLSASAEDGGAKVSTSGNDLSVGANTVTITVTAPSGAVKRYTISVIRQPDPNYTASTDAALSALTASYGEISPAFTSDVTDYVLYVPHETEHITLSGTARDGKAVQVTGADAALDEGENVLTVTCTAEDGVTVMTYTVHVWRMPAYAGTLPQIIVPTDAVEPDQPAQEDASALSALWASLCAPFVLPFGGWTVPLYAVAAAAMVLLLLLLFLLGHLIGRRRGRRKALRQLEQTSDAIGVIPPADEPSASDETHPDEPQPEDGPQPVEEEPSAENEPVPQPVEAAPTEAPAAQEEPAAEEPSAQPEQTEEMPAEPSPDDTLEDLGDISLDDLLNDIRNM